MSGERKAEAAAAWRVLPGGQCVCQVPRGGGSRRWRQRALAELRGLGGRERPRLILDCSAIDPPTARGAFFLLCCLEEALKRNGDARLACAAVAPFTEVLQQTELGTLFAVFASVAEAEESYAERWAVSEAFSTR